MRYGTGAKRLAKMGYAYEIERVERARKTAYQQPQEKKRRWRKKLYYSVCRCQPNYCVHIILSHVNTVFEHHPNTSPFSFPVFLLACGFSFLFGKGCLTMFSANGEVQGQTKSLRLWWLQKCGNNSNNLLVIVTIFIITLNHQNDSSATTILSSCCPSLFLLLTQPHQP